MERNLFQFYIYFATFIHFTHSLVHFTYDEESDFVVRRRKQCARCTCASKRMQRRLRAMVRYKCEHFAQLDFHSFLFEINQNKTQTKKEQNKIIRLRNLRGNFSLRNRIPQPPPIDWHLKIRWKKLAQVAHI